LLRDQVIGLRTYARARWRASPARTPTGGGCYGVRPTYTDEAVFRGAHERLEELFPGDGPLAARKERWESSIRVPTRADRANDRGGHRGGASTSISTPASNSWTTSSATCAPSPERQVLPAREEADEVTARDRSVLIGRARG
jgi:hypothetical protein